jgi:predicted MFS family arabinose efflux permease
MGAFYGLYAVLGPHLTVDLGLPTALAGLAALVYGLGFGAAAPVVFAVMTAVYLALALAAPSAAAILALCAVWGGVNHLAVNLLVGRLVSGAPGARATVLGLYSATTSAAMFAGTAVWAALYAVQGFAAAALLSALGAGVILIAVPMRGRFQGLFLKSHQEQGLDPLSHCVTPTAPTIGPSGKPRSDRPSSGA